MYSEHVVSFFFHIPSFRLILFKNHVNSSILIRLTCLRVFLKPEVTKLKSATAAADVSPVFKRVNQSLNVTRHDDIQGFGFVCQRQMIKHVPTSFFIIF